MPCALKIDKNIGTTSIGYSAMTTRKLKQKMLKMYHRILKASVKRKFDKAEELNWKLLDLELKLRRLEDAD